MSGRSGVVLGWLMWLALPACAAGSLYDLTTPLTDDRGRAATLADWRGRPAIVTMEYADCRFVCSITLRRLQEVQAAADRARRDFVFIVLSLDPKNDTPAAWTRYRQTRDLKRENWVFLTAREADTPALARRLGVKYWLYDGHIMHDFRLLRLDGKGEVLKVMDTFDADADAFVR